VSKRRNSPFLAVPGDILDDAVERGVFPGASLLVAVEGKVVHVSYHGRLSDLPSSPPVSPATVYDLASITKPLALSTAMMLADARGLMDISWKAGRRIAEFRSGEKSEVAIRDLLSHRSGLPAWRPYHETAACPARDAIRRMSASEPLEKPRGAWTYSDIGFIVLDEFFELESGESLDTFLSRELYGPLGMADTFFKRLPGGRIPRGRRAAAVTDRVSGKVDDENCRCMGGVSGHAGLFSTTTDIHNLTLELLKGYKGRSEIFPSETVQKFWERPGNAPLGTHAMGWDTPAPKGSSSGTCFSPSSVGHLGFTGCSVWLDPERMLEVILLSNRVCPTRSNEQIKTLRPVLHDAVFQALSV
jgi:CubicO group peptidase (beta-lactamase class C family)